MKSINKREERIGEKRRMNCGAIATIIEYRTSKDIDVQFEDGYIVANREYACFKKGEITNPYYPTVYNIGYLGETTTIDKKGNRLKSYDVWRNMIARCYNPNIKNYKNYGAMGVTVCEEWHCYANFKKWFNRHYYTLENERVELDKDILVEGNKIYSPKTCIFAPKRINDLFLDSGYKNKNRELPLGVSKKDNKYEVGISIKDKTKALGRFNTPEEASQCYQTARSKYILELAEEYKDKIPNKLYKRLIKIATKIN